jgi:hypothetical protein
MGLILNSQYRLDFVLASKVALLRSEVDLKTHVLW